MVPQMHYIFDRAISLLCGSMQGFVIQRKAIKVLLRCYQEGRAECKVNADSKQWHRMCRGLHAV